MYALLLAQDTDEKQILSLVLQRAGLAVTTGDDLERAVRLWSERPADLIVLALETEPIPNLSLLRAVTDVPTILVANHLDESAHCNILEATADLVVQRPYSARLLVSQVRTLLRRAGGVQLFSLPTLTLAGLTLDPATRTVQVAGRPSHRLTHLEFRLLYTLMVHPDRFSPPRLLWRESGATVAGGTRNSCVGSSGACEASLSQTLAILSTSSLRLGSAIRSSRGKSDKHSALDTLFLAPG